MITKDEGNCGTSAKALWDWPPAPRRARLLVPATIAAVTFLAYASTLALGFVFDDHVLILTNDSIRAWHYFPSYFASHIWSFRYPHLLANYYRPLFLTWLRLNYMLFGLRPWGWHLTSALAHVAVTYLVYRLALRLVGDEWIAGAAGLLFGLHPIHVEAVADITSIQEPLSTAFILGAILAFDRSRKPQTSLPWLAVSLILTAAALLSKESGMIVPVLISLFAWFYPADSRTAAGSAVNWRALGAGLPFWAVVLAYVPLRIWALKGFAHIITPVSLTQKILTIPSVLIFYLRLMLWPSGLSCYYDTPYISSPSWRGFLLPALLLLASAAILALWYARSRREAPAEARVIAFAGLWAALTLVPVLNFSYLPRNEIAHDRYVYLPSVGLVLLAAVALRQALAKAPASVRRPGWLVLAAIVVSGVMGAATVRASLFWSDDLTLNYRAHEIAPHNVSAMTSLGAAVAERGMDGPAIELYRQALEAQPDFWRANVNLANLYYAHGDMPQAVHYFERACAADPTDGDEFLYLGMALLRMGRATEAENAVRTALLVRPHGKNYHLGLAMVLKQEGRRVDMRRELQWALADDPGNPQARALLEELEGKPIGQVK